MWPHRRLIWKAAKKPEAWTTFSLYTAVVSLCCVLSVGFLSRWKRLPRCEEQGFDREGDVWHHWNRGGSLRDIYRAGNLGRNVRNDIWHFTAAPLVRSINTVGIPCHCCFLWAFSISCKSREQKKCFGEEVHWKECLFLFLQVKKQNAQIYVVFALCGVFNTNTWHNGRLKTGRRRRNNPVQAHLSAQKTSLNRKRLFSEASTISADHQVPVKRPPITQTLSVFPPVYTRPLLTWQRPNIVLDVMLVSAKIWLAAEERAGGSTATGSPL